MIHILEGVECISLKEFSKRTQHSKQSIRRLIEFGNRFRALRAIKDGVHTYIPLSEVTEYPFVNERGQIYHYRLEKDGERIYEDDWENT